MSSVVLASASTDLARRMRLASSDDIFVLAPEQVPTGPAQLLGLANGTGPVQAVVLDVSGDVFPEASLGLAQRFSEQYPHIAVLLVTEHASALGLPALRAGVRDLLDPSLTIDELRWSLRRAIEASAAAGRVASHSGEDEISGRVITVASPKGGVGKTTLATNLAVGLAEHSPQGTVLVDLDIQFGDVAAALDLDPAYTLADVVHGTSWRDVMGLKTLLTKHGSGLHVLTGVRSPAEADDVTPEHVSTILGLLKSEFRYIILDTAPGLGEHTLAALDHTTDLVLVTSLDVPGIRGLRKEMELLDELDLPPATRHIAVNFAERGGGLAISDVETTIRRKVDFEFSWSRKVIASTNRGRPLIADHGRDRISRNLEEMVARFSPTPSRRATFRWSPRPKGGGPS